LVLFEVEENLPKREVFLKYSDKIDEAWLRIKTFPTNDGSKIVVTTSTGGIFNVSVQTAQATDGKKLRVLSLAISSPSDQSEFQLDGPLDSTQARLGLQNSLKSEERLFQNTGLQKLREVLRNFDRISHMAFKKVSSGETPSENIFDCLPDMEDFSSFCSGGGGCSGWGYCQRIASVIPLFACYGCSGSDIAFYVIPDDILVFWPVYRRCSYLNNCV